MAPIKFILLGMLAVATLRAQDAPPSQHLEITGSHRLRITYDCSFVWPGGGGSGVFHLPIPRETGNQRIENFTSNLKGVTESADNETPPQHFLTATLHHASGDDRVVHWRVQVTGNFQTRQLVDGPPDASKDPVVAPAPGEFLDSTESINWNTDSFQGWLDSTGLRRGGNESPVHYGARLFAYFRANGRYSYPPETAWNATAACHGLRTDCGGFSLVFAAACRANKIPARILAGQWFRTRESSDGTLDVIKRQAHVIAEFFDPQIGWIPEDISSTFLKTPGFPDLNFFGRDPGYFFAWHIDTDFHFDLPRKANAHIQWLQNPSFWFNASADEANDTVTHRWTLETLR